MEVCTMQVILIYWKRLEEYGEENKEKMEVKLKKRNKKAEKKIETQIGAVSTHVILVFW